MPLGACTYYFLSYIDLTISVVQRLALRALDEEDPWSIHGRANLIKDFFRIGSSLSVVVSLSIRNEKTSW